MAKKSSVATEEQAVRDAANVFHEAIRNAEAAGYRIHWPVHPNDLPIISVSETAKVERTRVVPVAEADVGSIEGGTTVSEVRTRVPTGENIEVTERTIEAPANKRK